MLKVRAAVVLLRDAAHVSTWLLSMPRTVLVKYGFSALIAVSRRRLLDGFIIPLTVSNQCLARSANRIALPALVLSRAIFWRNASRRRRARSLSVVLSDFLIWSPRRLKIP